jgi:NDP-sugar pyrophosphorylase family protein
MDSISLATIRNSTEDNRDEQFKRMKAADLFPTRPTSWPFEEDFPDNEFPWEWLPKIGEALERVFKHRSPDRPKNLPRGVHLEGDVFADPTVKWPPFAVLQGPIYIGPHCEIRPGAYLRGNVIVGSGCVLGNSCEYKNSILFDHVQTPHYNYVGDSILGYRSHLGAGVILSNLRFDRGEICIRYPDGQKQPTGLKKMGACVGEKVEVGCNAVLLPGSLLGPQSAVYPCCRFGGVLPPKTLFRTQKELDS